MTFVIFLIVLAIAIFIVLIMYISLLIKKLM